MGGAQVIAAVLSNRAFAACGVGAVVVMAIALWLEGRK